MNQSLASQLQGALTVHRQGGIDEAIRRYEDLLAIDSLNADALHYLAMARCQKGQFDRGIALARQVLTVDSQHAPALNLMGMAQVQLRQPREALASFERALAIKPDFADAHGNRAGVLLELGRREEALEAYDKAVAANPNSVVDLMNRGALQADLGRHADALASFERVLALDPESPSTHFNRANTLQALGRLAEALQGYDYAVAVNPQLVQGFSNRGLVLKQLGRDEEALASFNRALALRPDFVDARLNRALLHLAAERWSDALADLDDVIAREPHRPGVWRHRAYTLLRLDRHNEAIASSDRALAHDANDRIAHLMRGIALYNLARDSEALQSLDAAAALAPDDARTHSERAAVLSALGRKDEAFAAIDRALALGSDNPFVTVTASDVHLLHGRWDTGWTYYERRFEIDPAAASTSAALPYSRWTGEAPGDYVLVLVTEQGAGDAIHFSRFGVELAKRGYRVAILSPKALVPLLGSLDGVERIVTEAAELSSFGEIRWLPMLSLPFVLGLKTPDDAPAQVPYLKADSRRVERWRARLGDGLKVGIAWQGNPNFRYDRGRSIPLAAFAPLAEVPGVRLIALQKGFGSEQIAQAPFRDRIETLGEDFDTEGGAFMDTAAVMEVLDIVVTSDTSILHLAGALGRPTYAALRGRMIDWRWLRDREDSPWYPTMRLVRQSRDGDWSDVFARIAAEIRRRAAN
jgi:tetratricopeptide (TPR) repeat protein